MMDPLEGSLIALAGPHLETMGLRLVELELSRQGRRLLVRVFVERVDRSSGGVTAEECGEANLSLGRLFELEEAVGESYVLEVSSPGLNRRIRWLADFESAVGENVTVVTREAIGGRKRFRGRLVSAQEAGIEVEIEGKKYDIPLDAIARANMEYDFTGRAEDRR